MAAFHDLGVAGHHLHLGATRRRGDRLHLVSQLFGRQSLFEHERQRQRERPCAGDGEVVHAAVHRELSDRAAREADGLHHEAVRGDRDSEIVQHRGIAERLRTVRRERRCKEALDHALRGLATGAVSHSHALIAELRAFATRGLDDPERGLLCPHTTSRSRAKRPKL